MKQTDNSDEKTDGVTHSEIPTFTDLRIQRAIEQSRELHGRKIRSLDMPLHDVEDPDEPKPPEEKPPRLQIFQDSPAPALPEPEPKILSFPLPESKPQETIATGLTKVGLSAGALGVLPGYLSTAKSVVAGTVLSPAPGVSVVSAGSLPVLSTMLAAPAAGAGVGYYLGKKMKHPVLGSVVGGSIGAAGGVTARNSLGASAAAEAIGGGSSTLFGALAGLGTGGSLALAAGSAAVTGMITYGLGRVDNELWEAKPGTLGTYLRGIIAPVSIPVGLIKKGIQAIRNPR